MFSTLRHFINISQLSSLQSYLAGEERQYFLSLLKDLENRILHMPTPYETTEQGIAAPVSLHYFKGGSDWYIVEKDSSGEQLQAFGYACLNGDKINAEMGYINIEELIKCDVEFDLYWTPTALRNVIDKKYITIEESSYETYEEADLI
ncbi:MAG: hypothetical protein CVU54_12205 [Deltaproteobacteria bacterium HGW-Deltaproteobacteria-12]|jgi:hypothetical protein|nr:MAG: hypothetical protein CVU54_12205 [Deltaproteobacteria bacterium HGW-Deltaproteobacteria-12]